MSGEISLAPFDGVTAPEGMVFQYQVTMRGGRLTHEWALHDERGGVHVHAALSDFQGRKEWYGGIECHWPTAPDYMNADKPSHDHCWLLGKPCWHDGSSLYFSENIADALPQPWSERPHQMSASNHRYVMCDLIRWHRDKIVQKDDDA